MKIRRALISVFDKVGLIEFAACLCEHGIEIISTGNTASTLSAAGISTVPVEQFTGWPEMLGGRVKTLHPKIHGGILVLREDPHHEAEAATNHIRLIDLVVVNLYPFSRTAANPKARRNDIIEQIDIGGPTLLRSAAKNHQFVTAIVDPADYELVIEELRDNRGETTFSTRQTLAAKVFAATSGYDAAIHKYLHSHNA